MRTYADTVCFVWKDYKQMGRQYVVASESSQNADIIYRYCYFEQRNVH